MANVTIDDSDSSIIYLPPTWNIRSPSVACPACSANPQMDMMFNETWHDNTFYPVGSSDFVNKPITASVLFNGTALYVFCALAESLTSPDGDSDMSFYIDGELKGTFFRIAPGNPNVYDYNVPVFTIESLMPEEHNFTLQIGHVNGIKSMVLFDKMIYTAFDPTSTSSSLSLSFSSISSAPTLAPTSSGESSTATKKSPWNIIGPAVAVTVALLLLAVLALRYLFRQRKQQRYSIQRQIKTLDPMARLPYIIPTSSTSPTFPTQEHSRRVVPERLGSGTQASRDNTTLGTTSCFAIAPVDEDYVDAPPPYSEIEVDEPKLNQIDRLPLLI